MGYSTEFYGNILITPTPSNDFIEKVNEWLKQRHMIFFSTDILSRYPYADDDTVDGLPVADNGWNWINGYMDSSSSTVRVVDPNCPPTPCTSLWSDWTIVYNGSGGALLTWNGDEKSYDMWEWLQLLIDHVFAPYGYVLNGSVDFQGENDYDSGNFTVVDNVISGNRPY